MALAPLPAICASEGEMRGIVASPDQILAWLSVAYAGDRFLYAYRFRLPDNSQGSAQMRKLQSAGMVTLSQKRSDLHAGEFRYYATRTSRPLEEARGPAPERAKLKALAAPILDEEAKAIDAVYPLIDRAARFGRPCPSDAQLADRSGVARDRVAPTLDAMVAIHLIRIQRVSAPTHRLVTIIASGHRTGLAK